MAERENTVSRNIYDIVGELSELVDQINKHPNVQTVIAADDNGSKWLQTCNAINGHIENVDPGLLELLNKLDSILNEEFITDKGQHSKNFYDIKKFGWHFRTGESDSFGPLSSVMTPPDYCWSVCYG